MSNENARDRTDRELAEMIANRDPRVVGCILSTYGPALAAHFSARVASKQDVRDLVSATVSDVVRHYDGTKTASVRTFLFLVGKRRLADLFRSRQRDRLLQITDAIGDYDGASDSATPLEAMVDEEDRHQRLQAIRLALAHDLTEVERKAVQRRYFSSDVTESDDAASRQPTKADRKNLSIAMSKLRTSSLKYYPATNGVSREHTANHA